MVAIFHNGSPQGNNSLSPTYGFSGFAAQRAFIQPRGWKSEALPSLSSATDSLSLLISFYFFERTENDIREKPITAEKVPPSSARVWKFPSIF